MTDLLDASILIPLCVRDHVHREATLKWIESSRRFAVCPTTEGALVRYLFRVTLGDSSAVRTILQELRLFAGYEFWPDDLSYDSVDLSRLSGHKQVTDAYLVALATAHGGRLATFVKALVALHPEAVLVPDP